MSEIVSKDEILFLLRHQLKVEDSCRLFYCTEPQVKRVVFHQTDEVPEKDMKHNYVKKKKNENKYFKNSFCSYYYLSIVFYIVMQGAVVFVTAW